MLKAVVYDFDGTLTPETWPEFKILEKSGMKDGTRNPAFFPTAQTIAKERNIDVYEAMIRLILETVQQAGFPLTDENIALGADQRTYNPGVPEFLANLRKHSVRNYLLSSGSQAYLKYLTIAPEFTEIYASTLSYDSNGEINGIARVMSVEEKAVALQEIAQQVNSADDDFSGIIYIGDGPTDVAAMEYIKKHGGGAILVQHEINDPNLPTVDPSIVDLATKPDFTQNSELAKYINARL